MKPTIDHTGKVFKYLTVIRRSTERNRFNQLQWVCRCVCGEELDALFFTLKSGARESCGCMRNKHRITHGMTNSPEYKAWQAIQQRCYNTKLDTYKRYGERGITVCKRWLMGFEYFFHDMGPRPSDDYSIERTDVDGNYCPENCIWATTEVQNNNKRNSNVYIVDGIRKPLTKIAEEHGIKRETLYARLTRGRTLEEALSM
jgi:hypothetical protein